MSKWILFLLTLSNLAFCGNKEAFSRVYDEGIWGKNEEGIGFSGAGSNEEAVAPFVEFLKTYIKKHKIRSIVDLGCGDWTYSRHFNWGRLKYTGIDVVESVIARNQKKFATGNIQFICGDATQIELPKADLLICKAVLQHLPNADVLKILEKVKQYRYCLFVNDVDPITRTSENPDIVSGGYRYLDLRREPFHVKGQVHAVYEVYLEDGKGPPWVKSVFCVENEK